MPCSCVLMSLVVTLPLSVLPDLSFDCLCFCKMALFTSADPRLLYLFFFFLFSLFFLFLYPSLGVV
ncbi:unnamed protein product [Citrullus colocynthis]|uniref:Uncharacterized protein n=1 Tax=Citrullus colocynthis TaxID=252529 RepID=A0ABP0XLR7_9ROSI